MTATVPYCFSSASHSSTSAVPRLFAESAGALPIRAPNPSGTRVTRPNLARHFPLLAACLPIPDSECNT
jgi:hypothetical protein